jgi:hypothetical protein
MARPEETLAESRARQLAATGRFSDLAALRRQLCWEGFEAIELRRPKTRLELMDIIDANRAKQCGVVARAPLRTGPSPAGTG